MASVFLSYDHDDRARAAPIAAALEKAGHSVWWDFHVRGGAQFSKVIEAALKEAEAVVVLWSRNAIESAWVRDEAAAGRDNGRLIPISLDGTTPPLGFRQFQMIDLSGWSGRGKPARLKAILEAVESVAHGEVPSNLKPEMLTRSLGWPELRLNRWHASGIALLLGMLVFLGIVVALPWRSTAAVPLVTVAAADRSAASDALARDLLVKLGAMRAATMGTVRLASSDVGKPGDADLIFEAGAGADPQQPQASLTLKRRGDRAILWSKSFQPETRNHADLQQQLALNGGKVLECAVEALDPANAKIKRDTVRLYLTACARMAEEYGFDTREVARLFSRVVEQAPQFKSAWSKLLIAGSECFGIARYIDGWREPLKEHIAAARKIDRDLAEISIAEFALLPMGDFNGRSDLMDRAVKLEPESPYILNLRSLFLLTVGSGNAAVADARHASELDPLSPAMRNAYITTLASTGRIEAAQAELREAERMWPGASTLDEARYRLDLRYGDPKAALKMQAKVGKINPLDDTLLKARIDPSLANVEQAVAVARKAAQEGPFLSHYVQTMGAFGREDELFDALLHWKRADLASEVAEVLFRPMLRRFRHDPRFMEVAARIGLVDYWRKSGEWPDFCFEPDLPYDCKTEAAKLR